MEDDDFHSTSPSKLEDNGTNNVTFAEDVIFERHRPKRKAAIQAEDKIRLEEEEIKHSKRRKKESQERILETLLSDHFYPEESNQLQKIMEMYPNAMDGFIDMLRIFCHKLNETKMNTVQDQKSTTSSTTKEKEIAPSPKTKMENVACTLSDLKFVLPRKKLTIELEKDKIRLRSAQKIEKEISSIDILRIIYLPSPDQEKTFFVTFVAKNEDDSFCFSVKQDSTLNETVSETFHLEYPPSFNALDKIKLILSKFFSMVPTTEASKLTLYVPCNMKTKEGFLFLLQEGILFGMKKPIIFIPLSTITSVDYSSITSRTVNLDINTKEKSFQFSMINKEHKSKLDNYLSSQNLLAKGKATKKDEKRKQERIKSQKQEEEEEEEEDEDEDEDYMESGEELVPEDFDENYQSEEDDEEERKGKDEND